jgi:hypothetical protein
MLTLSIAMMSPPERNQDHLADDMKPVEHDRGIAQVLLHSFNVNVLLHGQYDKGFLRFD